MSTFASFDGTECWFDDQELEPGESTHTVVLLHGFAADTNLNYVRSGILDALLDAGHRTVALDFRGHGLSAKPHDPAAYGDDALTRDVQALLDHLGVDDCVVVGYSMGSGVALRLGAIDRRVRAVVALGVGGTSLERHATGGSGMRDGLLADDPATISDPNGRRFRHLADSVRADRVALAACIGVAQPRPAQHLDEISVPVLVVAGADDDLAGDPTVIADRLADGTGVVVPGDHFTSNARPELHEHLLAFVARR